MPFLTIVIPRYTEPQQNMFPLLSIIYDQVGVKHSDLEAIIVNDGGGVEPLSDDFLALFAPLSIRQINLTENVGPGMARQAGIDAAQGDYIMFCDADDTLYSVGSIEIMMQEAQEHDPDILTSKWFEEVGTENGGHVYITHEQETTWMHGKFYKRSFIQENDIRHHQDLRIHEDSYFNAVACSHTNNMRYIAEPTYIWKFRPDSITRRDNAAYTYNSLPTFIFAMTEAYAQVEGLENANMEYSVCQIICYLYFIVHQMDWMSPEHLPDMEAVEQMLANRIAPYFHYWMEAKPETRIDIYNQERTRSFGRNIEIETIDVWLARIGLLEFRNVA